jgi:PAB-dependent poly(A)-specific ribonuclease subunit 3
MMQVVDVWKKFSHPNCVALREVFTTKAFGDNSLILVYDFHAGEEENTIQFNSRRKLMMAVLFLSLLFSSYPRTGSQNFLSKYFTPTSSNGYHSSVGSAFSGDARPFSHKNTLQRTGKQD